MSATARKSDYIGFWVIGEALAPRDNLTSGPISGFPFGRASPGDRASGAYKMPVKAKEITQDVIDRAIAILDYDPETGVLKWKPHNEHRGRGRPRSGKIVTSVNQHGYLRVMIDGVSYRAHRLAWSMFYGSSIPADKVIDHANGVVDDNRIANLRLTTQGGNMQNIRSAMSTSKSGLIGASWCTMMRRWRACIRIQGCQTVLSYHDTPEAAHQAYLEAKRRLHPGCTI